jgi:hypothetical protein
LIFASYVPAATPLMLGGLTDRNVITSFFTSSAAGVELMESGRPALKERSASPSRRTRSTGAAAA